MNDPTQDKAVRPAATPSAEARPAEAAAIKPELAPDDTTPLEPVPGAVPDAVAVPVTVEEIASVNPDEAAPTPALTASAVDEPGLAADFRREFESLATAVLDAADVASTAASAASQTGNDLLVATGSLRDTERMFQKRSMLTLGVLAALMCAGFAFMVTVGYVMANRVQRLDDTLLAVGKRAVEVNASAQSLAASSESLKALADQVTELMAAQEAIKTMQAQLDAKVDVALKQAETAMQQVPDRTAKQVAASSDGVNRQLQALGSRLQTQAGAMQTLTKDLKELSASVTSVDALRREIQSLTAAQRARATEAPQKIAPPIVREPMLQYPRPQPQGKDRPPATPAS